MALNPTHKEDAYIPRWIPTVFYLPGRRIAEYRILLKNVPGALNAVTETLRKYGANVISICAPPVSTEETAWVTIGVDLTNATASPEEVAERLRRRRKLLSVEYVEGNDFLLEAYHFKLLTALGRAFVQNVNGYAEIVKALRAAFGSAADFVLFMQGVNYGEAVVRGYCKAFPFLFEGGVNNVAKFLAELGRSHGFAILKFEELNLDKGVAQIVAYDLYECEPFRGQLNSANSQYFRGMISGITRALTGIEDYVFFEEKCIAKGDPYCSFKLERVKQSPSRKT